MLKIVTLSATAAAMMTLSALNTSLADTDVPDHEQFVQIASAEEEAAHKALSIVGHMKHIADGIRHSEMEMKNGEKRLHEIEKMKAKNKEEEKKRDIQIQRIKHSLEKLAHRLRQEKDQLHHGKQMADNIARHMENRLGHLERVVKHTFEAIRKMEHEKKPKKEIEEAKKFVE